VFITIAAFIIFFEPTAGGWFLEHDNFIPANPLATPEHIKPVWYFTPYYAMLRAVPSFIGTQVWGVIVMGAAVLILFLLPWLDCSPVKSIRYRPALSKVMIGLFVITFVTLGWLGTQPAEGSKTIAARIFTFVYFAFFITMPMWTRMGTFKPVPDRVTMHD